MGKKRSSSQIEKLPTAPKDEQPPTQALTLALKDNEKPLSQHPEEDKDEEDSSASSSETGEAEEAEEEDDDEEDDSPSKITTPSVNPKTEDDSDSGDEETDSDSEEDPAPKLKSLNSAKPLLQIKSNVEAKPSSAPTRSGTKRPVDNDPKQPKKRKITVLAAAAVKAPEEDNKKSKSGDDSKKLFQRVFTEDDEIAIMKGLYDYITTTRNDPFKWVSAFYEFVKKSIHSKVTLEQLKDKMRRLKLKYETKVKSGKTSNFPKESDRVIFEFGQKIWGGKLNLNEAEEKGKPNGKLSKKEPAAKKPRTTTKKLVLAPDSPLVVKETEKVERTDRENPGPSLALNELLRFDESISASRNPVAAMERGMELAEESEKEELKRRWEKVQIAELEAFEMRTDLAVNQAISLLEALKSSSSD